MARTRTNLWLSGGLLFLALVWGRGQTLEAQTPGMANASDRERALHVLNRITFGPRPGDVDRVLAIGVDRFIAQQLHPETIDDRPLEEHLKQFEILTISGSDLARTFRRMRQEQRQRQMRGDSARFSAPMVDSRQRPRDVPTSMRQMRRLTLEFQQVAVVRATMAERQLYEVMVDFWTNHFNVFLGKGPERTLMPSYIEQTIRAHALGSFEELLIATAQSPAMLFYLDNAQSVAPGSRPPQLDRMLAQRSGRQGREMRQRRQMPDSMLRRIEERLPKGLNENYARELLELHTLGVDGGYSQEDVVNVARILTGWSVTELRRGGQFRFNDWAHDRDEKVVLGVRFPADRGMEEGMELLRRLASHPSTRRHISAKLCARFVHDQPPPGCIDAGVHAWERSNGDIREVVAAILRSPEFWAAEVRGAKIKTPLEYVVSAVRSVGGTPDTTLALAQVIARLGQPLYRQSPPTGYPETQESWVNSGALLDRLNVSMRLAAGRLRGIRHELEAVIPLMDDPEALVEAVNTTILNGSASPNTLRVMREQAESAGSPREARTLVVGLGIGSPEFQRQ